MASSFASFYVTLADRILRYFYGKERKNFTNFQKWKLIFTKPSHCEKCQKNLNPIELIPVLGYILTGGKCRNCKTKLSKVFLFSEILFPLLFLFIYLFTQKFFLAISFVLVFGHIFVSMLTDFHKFIIDYENLVFVFFFGMIYNFLLPETDWILSSLFTGLVFLFFFILLYLLAPSQIGLGDVLFAPVYALLSGHPWWMLFLNSCYTIALAIAFLQRKKNQNWRKKKIPMGLYFGIGLTIALLAKTFYLYSL